MTEPDQPTPPAQGPDPGPPAGPPLGGPPLGGAPGVPGGGTPPSGPPPPGAFGQPQYGQAPYGQAGFAQPAAQPYMGGYHGPDWIPELNVQAASAGARVGAKALDIIFVVLIQSAISVVGVFALFASTNDAVDTFGGSGGLNFSAGSNLALTMVLNLVLLAMDAIYNVVVVSRFGGQPGKLILGLRIVHTDGRPIDARGALIRWSPILALTVLSWVPVFVMAWLILLVRLGLLVANLVLVLVDDRHRSVFDRVAGTYVVVHR